MGRYRRSTAPGIQPNIFGFRRVGEQDQLFNAEFIENLRAKTGLLDRAHPVLIRSIERIARLAEQTTTPRPSSATSCIAGQLARRFWSQPQKVRGLVQRMGPGQHRLGRGDVALDQHDVFHIMGLVGKDPHFPRAAIFRGHGLARGLIHQIIILGTIGDQIGNRADLHVVGFGKLHQIRQPRHGAIVFHDLADHRRGMQPSNCEISTEASV